MTAPASAHREFAAALQVPTLSVPSALKGGGGHDAERRFAVHRNNFVVGLVDALAESFPVTQALVGQAFFRGMARERVLADPPRSPLLTDYALGFADFVAGFAPAAVVPYLADVARIEALRIQAYHAADAVPLPGAAYEGLLADPEQHFHISSEFKGDGGIGDIEFSVKEPDETDNVRLTGMALASGDSA